MAAPRQIAINPDDLLLSTEEFSSTPFRRGAPGAPASSSSDQAVDPGAPGAAAPMQALSHQASAPTGAGAVLGVSPDERVQLDELTLECLRVDRVRERAQAGHMPLTATLSQHRSYLVRWLMDLTGTTMPVGALSLAVAVRLLDQVLYRCYQRRAGADLTLMRHFAIACLWVAAKANSSEADDGPLPSIRRCVRIANEGYPRSGPAAQAPGDRKSVV